MCTAANVSGCGCDGSDQSDARSADSSVLLIWGRL
jgi:hypothetical protein